jgi:hypothetical protein
MTSSFDPSSLPTWAIRLLAQVPRVPRAEFTKLLANTYGGFLASRDDLNWRHRIVNELEELIGRMLSLGLAEEEGEFVRLTLLGRACGRSALSFESAMRLVDLLRSIDLAAVTAERLVAIMQALAESDGGYTPMMSAAVQKVSDREKRANVTALVLSEPFRDMPKTSLTISLAARGQPYSGTGLRAFLSN